MNRYCLSLLCLLIVLLSIPKQGMANYLGGPCDSTSNKPTLDKNTYEGAVEHQKYEIRQFCTNIYRWYRLISIHLQYGKKDAALEVFDQIYQRKLNIHEEDFSFGDSYSGFRKDIKQFMESEYFKKSSIGNIFDLNMIAANKRKLELQKTIEKMDSTKKPPVNYVNKGACPFECCVYREWKAKEDTVLVDKPYGTRIVGKVFKDQTVAAITGEVHLEPTPIVIVHDIPTDDLGYYKDKPLKKGDILFLLDYTGEGFFNFWYDGEIYQAELHPYEYCMHPSESCWVEYIYPKDRRKERQWWVQMRLEDGTIGWTNKPKNFSNKDACG